MPIRATHTHDEIVRAPIRVVSIPAAHPYVSRITASEALAVLPDPPVPGKPAEVWWPPVALSPEWIAAHADDADILHVHFGTESYPPGHLSRCIEAAHSAGWPVVYTVHDLQNPQVLDQLPHHRQLDELIRGADALVTLTSAARDEIHERWNRDATVIPHPAMLSDDHPPAPRRGPDGLVVGLHVKDLRPNIDGPRSVAALLAVTEALRREGVDVSAEVRMHRFVRDEAARDAIRRLCAGSEHVVLREHGRLSDAELAVALGRLDICVLPYRHGTHSGWLELCWDLGVLVAAPARGHYLGQHGDGSVAAFDPDNADSLRTALRRLLDHPDATRPGAPAREHLIAERRRVRMRADADIAAAHVALYRSLVGRGAA